MLDWVYHLIHTEIGMYKEGLLTALLHIQASNMC